MNANDIRLVLPPSPRTVLHWFDFICPLCYLGQQRNQILSRHGLEIVHLPFQIHPDIPPEGVEAGANRRLEKPGVISHAVICHSDLPRRLGRHRGIPLPGRDAHRVDRGLLIRALAARRSG
jgi:predicted DsbA family dithiol-disulfide isomerase